MKNIRIITSIVFSIMLFTMVGSVFAYENNSEKTMQISALGGGFDTNNIPSEPEVKELKNTRERVWGIVLTVLQVAAISGVIFAGVRYMFVSAEKKADIKSSLINLCIGMVIVFGASTVVKFVVNSFTEITK